jgi:hypothetical protein
MGRRGAGNGLLYMPKIQQLSSTASAYFPAYIIFLKMVCAEKMLLPCAVATN